MGGTNTRALVDDWFAHSQYLAMFLLGVLLARTPTVWTRFAQWRWPALGPAPEAAVLAGATLLVCLAGFEAVRRIGWLRAWMGLEPHPGAVPSAVVPGARELP